MQFRKVHLHVEVLAGKQLYNNDRPHTVMEVANACPTFLDESLSFSDLSLHKRVIMLCKLLVDAVSQSVQFVQDLFCDFFGLRKGSPSLSFGSCPSRNFRISHRSNSMS